ncbi:MAG: DUF5668 domain-containing protein [Candidatus Korobacteraceae bacterium]
MRYRYNSYCPCARCRAHGFMGPAVLITIGVLFLLDQMGHQHWMDFSFTWPALLIVIGVIKMLEHSASTNGHIPREYSNLPPNPGQIVPPGTPGYPMQPQGPVTPPPPGYPAGFIAPNSSVQGPDDKGGA